MRVVAGLGVLAGVIIPLLLLVKWGEIDITTFQSAASDATVETTRSFSGTRLSSGFHLELFLTTGLVVLCGALEMIRPLRYRLVAIVAALAAAAQLVFLWLEFRSSGALPRASISMPNLDSSHSRFVVLPFVAASAAGAVSLIVWLLLAATPSRKLCPDCASQVGRNAINCPHCDYEFPLDGSQKRCEECRRPVKAEALVCRHCKHRFDTASAAAP